MLLALIALAAGALAGGIRGRRPGRSGSTWKAPLLVPVAGVLLVAGQRWISGVAGLVVMAVGYLALTAFTAANARRPGLVLVAVGLLANLSVTVADGGMPVRGQPPGVPVGDHHHGLSTRDHLAGLADTIRVPPLRETVSPGDLLVASGGAVAVFFWLDPVTAPTRRRRPRSRDAVGPV